MKDNFSYWAFPEAGFPITIYWKIVAGNRRLTVLEDHDIVFDKYDLKIRKMNLNDLEKQPSTKGLRQEEVPTEKGVL